MIKSMGKEPMNGRMELVMKDNLNKVKSMGKEPINGRMA